MRCFALIAALLVATGSFAYPSFGRSAGESPCTAEGVLTPLGDAQGVTLTCMLVWPAEPSIFPGYDGSAGCQYTLAYSYEVADVSQGTLRLVTETVVEPLTGPSPEFHPDSSSSAGTRGFFWPSDGDLAKLVARSVATFTFEDKPLLEWRILPKP
jgi:hypothetical protein